MRPSPDASRWHRRTKVRLCTKARVVAFWDFKHGQTGVAQHAIELHPILGFTCLVP